MKSHFYTLGQDTLIVQEHKSPADGEIRYAWIIKGWFMNYLDSRWAEPRGRKTFTSFTAALLAGIHFLNYLRAYNRTAQAPNALYDTWTLGHYNLLSPLKRQAPKNEYSDRAKLRDSLFALIAKILSDSANNPTRCHAPTGGSTTNPQGEIAQCLTD